jgi:tetratricopeptide (TPR) repeat protein
MIDRLGGCPQALKQILGYLDIQGQSLSEALTSFDVLPDRLLDDMFEHIWRRQLDHDSHYTLLAATMCPQLLPRRALAAITALSAEKLNRAIAQLTTFALLDAETLRSHPDERRYSLHPLTYKFATFRYHEYDMLIETLQTNWIRWAAAHAQTFDYPIDDPVRFAQLVVDEPLLAAALQAAMRTGHYPEAIQLIHGLEFYYYRTGRWQEKLQLHQHYHLAAEALADPLQQIRALTMDIRLLCRLGRVEVAAERLERLQPLLPVIDSRNQLQFEICHTQALYAYHTGVPDRAERFWQEILGEAESWKLPDHARVGTYYWLGMNLLQQGRPGEARTMFERSYQLAQEGGMKRWSARNLIWLGITAIELHDLTMAWGQLMVARDLTEATDLEQLAQIYRAEAQFYRHSGNERGADAAFQVAMELFTQMGLAHEL